MKILVVDDDMELLGLIGFALRQAGYLVIDAVRYSAAAPWPALANGGGAALQLNILLCAAQLEGQLRRR